MLYDNIIIASAKERRGKWKGKRTVYALPALSFRWGSLFLGLWGLTGLVGVALSAVGRSQAENNGQKTGLGTAGIILGVIGALWCWVMLVIAMS